MKKLYFFLFAVCFVVTACGNTEEPECKVCGIDNPLQDIEWLKEYCESIETQDFFKVKIDLYRVIEKNEYVFNIHTYYPLGEVSPEVIPVQGYVGNLSEWRNCDGKVIFGIPYPGTPPIPGMVENFMKDKEFVTELFDYLAPVCGVNNPLQNIEWLKEYCDSIKEEQNFLGVVRIDLCYGRGKFVFNISTFFQGCSDAWRNCAGEELDFPPCSFITNLFYFDKTIKSNM